LVDKVIPFFDKYKIIGIKFQDYQDFKKVADLIKNKDHLTVKGLNKINKIKEGMNNGIKQN
jgi:LAGLIDADG DNA endonuclease family protein